MAWGFQVNPDSCGNHEHYEQYLRLIAAEDRINGAGLTYILLDDEPEERICGFITLRTSSVIKKYDNQTVGEAAIEITELAVDKTCERQGVGKLLLSLAVSIASDINAQYASVKYIALCADKMAVPFYSNFGFECLENQGDIPREGWNRECVPMVLRLPDN